MTRVSIEQHVRDLLSLAIRDGLVAECSHYHNPDPQVRSSGELSVVANHLSQIIRLYASAAVQE